MLTFNAAAVGIAIGAYGTRAVTATAAHLPVEFGALSLAGGAYMQACKQPLSARELAAAAAATAPAPRRRGRARDVRPDRRTAMRASPKVRLLTLAFVFLPALLGLAIYISTRDWAHLARQFEMGHRLTWPPACEARTASRRSSTPRSTPPPAHSTCSVWC